MRIDLETGEYLREAAVTFAEIEWFYSVMADWPAGGWSLQRCSNQVSKSGRVRAFDQPFVGLVLVYCLADDTPVGVCRCSYYGGETTGFQVDYAAVHPDYRGQGHFTRLADGIAYWVNQVLEADEAVYQVLDVAPQVMTRSRALAGEDRAIGLGSVGELSEVKFVKADVAAVMRSREIAVRG